MEKKNIWTNWGPPILVSRIKQIFKKKSLLGGSLSQSSTDPSDWWNPTLLRKLIEIFTPQSSRQASSSPSFLRNTWGRTTFAHIDNYLQINTKMYIKVFNKKIVQTVIDNCFTFCITPSEYLNTCVRRPRSSLVEFTKGLYILLKDICLEPQTCALYKFTYLQQPLNC